MDKKDIIVGVTGASGAIYGKLLLEKIRALESQVDRCDLIVSEHAGTVWNFELGADPLTLFPPGDAAKTGNVLFRYFSPRDFFAPMASGSAAYDAMIICPCTMGTLGRIAAGVAEDLMTRAADVMLKERRKLILVPRETPLSLIHLKNMKLLTEAGAIICPANPSFYSKPGSIDALAMTVVNRVLTLAGLEIEAFKWG